MENISRTSAKAPIPYFTTLHGCLKLLQVISLTVGIVCSFLSTTWLQQPGGTFTIFVLVFVLLYTIFFLVIHIFLDITGFPRIQKAEWYGCFGATVFLLLSTIVCSVIATKRYFEIGDNGVTLLLDNSPIHSAAVFSALACLFVFIEMVDYGRKIYVNRRSLSQQQRANNSNHHKTAQPNESRF